TQRRAPPGVRPPRGSTPIESYRSAARDRSQRDERLRPTGADSAPHRTARATGLVALADSVVRARADHAEDDDGRAALLPRARLRRRRAAALVPELVRMDDLASRRAGRTRAPWPGGSCGRRRARLPHVASGRARAARSRVPD